MEPDQLQQQIDQLQQQLGRQGQLDSVILLILGGGFSLSLLIWVGFWVFSKNRTLPNDMFLSGMTVFGVICAVIALAFGGALDKEATGVILSSIVGYILGRQGISSVRRSRNRQRRSSASADRDA